MRGSTVLQKSALNLEVFAFQGVHFEGLHSIAFGLSLSNIEVSEFQGEGLHCIALGYRKVSSMCIFRVSTLRGLTILQLSDVASIHFIGNE